VFGTLNDKGYSGEAKVDALMVRGCDEDEGMEGLDLQAAGMAKLPTAHCAGSRLRTTRHLNLSSTLSFSPSQVAVLMVLA